MSHDATPPEAQNIDLLIDPASAYMLRESSVAACERDFQERNFGITDALLAGVSLTTSMIDTRYWAAKATAWYSRRAFRDRYNKLYPSDPLSPAETQQVARAILELSDIHGEIGI